MNRSSKCPQCGGLVQTGHQWKCPDCDGRCRIRSSRREAPGYRTVYLECRQESCGWRGKGECSDGETPRITGGF